MKKKLCVRVIPPQKYPRSVICLDIFLYFLGTNWRHGTSALYRFPRSIGPRYNDAAVYFLQSTNFESFCQVFALTLFLRNYKS